MAKKLKKAPVIEQPKEPELPEEKVVSVAELMMDSISSFDKYAERFLKVQTLEGDLVRFEFNDIQKIVDAIIQDIRSKKRMVRLVILKARREGISTYFAGRFYFKTATNPNRYAMMLTHEPEATDFLFHMQKRFQQHVPTYIKPTEKYNNKRMLEFNNDKGTGLDSAIRVGTAGKEDLASSQLIHYLHLSELAKYPSHLTQSLLTSIFQCVPDTAETEIVIESTGKGIGGEFYTRYWGCRYNYEIYMDNGIPAFKEVINYDSSESNEFSSVFIPWFVFDKYKMTPKYKLDFTPGEVELASLYNLSVEQIVWRRWAIENKCNGNVELFNQEYPHNAMSAFISTSDSIFSTEKLLHLIKEAQPPKIRYNVQISMGNWIAHPDGKLKVWQEPLAGREYIVSADVAEGLIKGDFSSADIIDVKTGFQVATFHGKFPPDHFGLSLMWVAKRYNNALICIERNNHGLTSINTIADRGYTRMYSEMVVEPPSRPRKRFGWVTSKTSKDLIIDGLDAELRDNVHGINDVDTFKEMISFKRHEDGSSGAEEGMFDDRVMSFCIGKYIRTKLPYIRNKTLDMNKDTYYNSINSGNINKVPSGAWT